jgi:hypothetical protein
MSPFEHTEKKLTCFLVAEVFMLLLFCGLFADYLLRYFRHSKSSSGSLQTASPSPVDPTRLKLFFGFMSLAIVLTLARCTYRLVELNQGYTAGSLVRDEVLFIALEGVYALFFLFIFILFSSCPLLSILSMLDLAK